MARGEAGPEERPTIEAWERHVPSDFEEGGPVAVLLHGRGSDEGDLLGLRDRLPDGVALLTPRAPWPGRPWGYGPGWAWYRYVAEDRVVGDTLEGSLGALDRFLDGVPDLLPAAPGAVFLGGFSQGGTTSLAYALRHPDRVAGVLTFSGFLPAEGLVELDGAPRLSVFWGHGRRDPNIPFELARKGRRRLAEAGAGVRAGDYDIGHWIEEVEMRDAAGWMEDVLAGRDDPGG